MATDLVDCDTEFAVVLDHDVGLDEWICRGCERVEHTLARHVITLVASTLLKVGHRHVGRHGDLDDADPAEDSLSRPEERLAKFGSVERLFDDHPGVGHRESLELAQRPVVDPPTKVVRERDSFRHPSRELRLRFPDRQLVVVDRVDGDVEPFRHGLGNGGLAGSDRPPQSPRDTPYPGVRTSPEHSFGPIGGSSPPSCSPPGITLSRHIIEEEHKHPSATGEFSILLQQISYAGRVLAHAIGRSPIDGITDQTGATGPTGDAQKKLDMLAGEIMRDAFARSELVAGIASEEHEDATEISVSLDAIYLLCLDPIDGSGNTGVNGQMGTIFGIFHRNGASGPVVHTDFLRPGREFVAAGYLLYGPSTMLVYTVGDGVHGFTLDTNIGEFLLTHPDLVCPPDGLVVAANTGRFSQWPASGQSFVDDLTTSGAGHLIRYSGAPVADTHRCLTQGGAFFYPPDADYPTGKLRTLYEAAPLAFIAEQAGGAASTGSGPILDVVPGSLHDTTPVIIGSPEVVARYEAWVGST